MQAKVLAEKLVRLPDAAEIGICLLGTIHHEERQRREAVDAYEQVLTLDPSLSRMPLPATLFWSEYTEDLIILGRAAEYRGGSCSRPWRCATNRMLHFLLARAERFLGTSRQPKRAVTGRSKRTPRSGKPGCSSVNSPCPNASPARPSHA